MLLNQQQSYAIELAGPSCADRESELVRLMPFFLRACDITWASSKVEACQEHYTPEVKIALDLCWIVC